MAYRFNNTLSGITRKIIIAFAIGGLTVLLAWYVSRVAFQKMLSTVESISSPDQKLQVVNRLYRDVTVLDQIQRQRAYRTKGVIDEDFFRESDSIRLQMTRLSALYRNDATQLSRIRDMQKLLSERDKLFSNYLKVRNGLVSGRDFLRQLRSLSGIIESSGNEADTTVVTTEQKFSSTIVHNLPDVEVEKQRGLLKRIFGRRKAPVVDTQQVVKEEVNVTVDTVAKANSDSVIREMERAVLDIRSRQRQRSSSFVNQEMELSDASNVLIGKILVILNSVEREALVQVDLNNQRARRLVNKSAESIEIIMLAFLLLTGVMLYLIVLDIGKNNRYREELEAAKEEAEYHSIAKQRFLSNMSHEIRTPLQSIIGYAEQLRRSANGEQAAPEAIYQSSMHLLHIVNEVLDYSRITSGKFSFRKIPFSMPRVLEEVYWIIKPQAESKGLSLRWELDLADTGSLNGDPFRLKQILINLLGNAVKFTGRGEVVLDVKSRKQGRKCYVDFRICDTGHGIKQTELNKIFGEFEQGDSPDPGLVQGTGLGLSIVKALVSGQGGTIEVASEENKGTCFSFRLKYLELKDAAPPREKGKPRQLPGSVGQVWIIDDDKFILGLGCSLLERHGLSHRCFERPSEMLSAVIPADLSHVLMDIRMPEMSGRELCEKFRQRLDHTVRIYAITAQVLPAESSEILSAGFDGILHKPFSEADFVRLLGLEAHVDPAKKMNLDVSLLRKMAMDDPELIVRIVKKFEEDSEQDAALIEEALGKADMENLALLVHRVAGRTAQLGALDLASSFRKVEHHLREYGRIDDQQIARLRIFLKDLRSIRAEEYVL